MTEPTDDTPVPEFAEWEDVEASSLLKLPIRGTTYTIPALGHLDAIRIRTDLALLAKGSQGLIDGETFLRMMLGDALEQMRADNVPDKAIVHAAAVAHADAFRGRAAAQELWREGIRPEAFAAALKAATAASSTTSPGSQPQARTSSTRKRASTASTKSPRTTGKRSPGTKSSPSRD